jgi:glycosyltransferase involved in cell wall biosynthesis
MRNCALVTCGSRGLQAYARRYNPNTLLLTSPVPDHGQRKPVQRGLVRRNDVFTIGWVGCFWGTHEAGLRALVYPALRDLGFRARLVVLGARNDHAEQRLREALTGDPWITIEVERDIPWCDEAAVHARIAAFDAGLAPLLDNEISRCKSAFKLKQYMSCGVPVLASPVGENTRFLWHGHNGLSCPDAASFRAAIYRLAGITDDAYDRMCREAMASTTAFNLETYAATFLEACGRLRTFQPPVGRRVRRQHPLPRPEKQAPQGT